MSYQDKEINGEIKRGCRAVPCEKVWNIIEPHIPNNAVIADIGSNLGYFGIKIAQKNNLVFSVESSQEAVAEQKTLLKKKGIYNIILAHYKIGIEDFQKLNRCVEAIDMFLFLSVLHHFPLKESEEIINLVSKLSPVIIVEFPVIKRGNSTGKQYKNFNKVLEKHFESVKKIGENRISPDQTRVIYKAENSQISRERLSPTLPNDLKSKAKSATNHRIEYNRFRIEYNWKITSKKNNSENEYFEKRLKFFPGLNAWNMLYFNPVWPEVDWWMKEGYQAYKVLIEKDIAVGDIKPFNLIITSEGMKPIDYIHGGSSFNKEKVFKELKKIKLFFKTMDPMKGPEIFK